MQRVFITGASSGLGAALAREYAQQGAVLGLLARRQALLQQLITTLPNPEQHQLYALDVTDHAALAAAAADFIARHGGIDIVLACAGISIGTLTGRADDLARIERIIATNLNATVASFAPFLASMQQQSAGRDVGCRLVGIGSIAGIRGLPGAGAYSASKAALISYCESLRVELHASGIKVVTISPGYVDTPMTRGNPYPMPFLMPAEQFARRAVRLIADGASYRVIPWQMGVAAKLLRLLPNWLYDRLFAKAPRKPRMQE